MNVYLDIDGVLLANDLSPASYADEFLRYVLTKISRYNVLVDYTLPRRCQYTDTTHRALIRQWNRRPNEDDTTNHLGLG